MSTTTPRQHSDHIIVGSGQATGTLVGNLPSEETIAIVEGSRFGGTCVNHERLPCQEGDPQHAHHQPSQGDE